MIFDWLTHERIVLIYAISGLLMFVASYFVYKYKPYCILNHPRREEAMEIYRKKLNNIPMTNEEMDQYVVLEHANKMDSVWRHRILGLSMLIHVPILAILIFYFDWAAQMPLYMVSCILLFIGGIDFFTLGIALPFCISVLPLRQIDILNSFYKKINNLSLGNEDIRNIKNTETEIKWYLWQRKVLFFALGLHFFASVVHLLIK